jgi:signal transduction histidine kinase
MSSQDFFANPDEFWATLGRFAQITNLEALWQEILAWLTEQTRAEGAWLWHDSPYPLNLTSGKIDEAAQAWLHAWVASGGPQSSMQGPWLLAQPSPDCSLLCVPWTDDGARRNGRLALTFDGQRQLSRADCVRLADAVQALAGLAGRINEARQTQERLSRFHHLYEMGQAIASSLDLQKVLKESTARVTEALGAEASSLMILDEARRELIFEIPAGPAEAKLREQRMPMDKGIAGWAVTHREPIIIPDVNADERFYTTIDQLTGYRTRSILAVPLQVQGKTVGVVEVINKTDGGSFTVDDQQWLSILAQIIAVAVENARLFTALREERDRIIAAEETVRHELARNLHDGPAQIMAAIILNVDQARTQVAAGPERIATELNFLDSLAQEANQEIRDLLFSLRPLSLETHGLTVALAQLVERLQSHVAYQIRLEVGELSDDAIVSKVAATLFVIVQEAINNIQKHAKAQHVWIRLGTSQEDLWVEVVDDGLGFDVRRTEADYSRLNSFGLLNMRERARLIDGRIEIQSPPPGMRSGTRVRVNVPKGRACLGA